MADPLENASLLKPGQVGGQISSRAMEAIPRGAQAMGKAVSSIGQAGTGIAMKMQEADNLAIMADFRRGLREASAEAEREMLNDPTGDKWQEIVANRMDAYEGSMLDMEGAGPEVRREMEIYMADHRGKLMQDVQTKAMLKKFERAETAAMAEVDDLIGRGDIDGAQSVVNSLPNWSPEKKEAFNSKARKRYEMDQIEASVMLDPWNLPELPDYLPEGEKEKIRRKAKANQDLYMSESMQDIADQIEAGELFDKDQISDMLDKDPIMANASEADRQIFYQRARNNLPMEEDELASLRGMINSMSILEQDEAVSQDMYEESLNKMRYQLAMHAKRPGIERLWAELEAYSPEAREERRRDGEKRHAFLQRTAAVNRMEGDRLKISDPEKLSRATKLDNWVASKLQEDMDTVGPKAIREFDEKREPNSPTWVERRVKELRTAATRDVDLAPVLDLIWSEDLNDENPLLPKKNALGE